MNRIWRVFPLVLVLLVIVRLPAAAQIGPLPLASFAGIFCTRKTRYYGGSKNIRPSDFKPGSRVTVESNVRLEPPKP